VHYAKHFTLFTSALTRYFPIGNNYAIYNESKRHPAKIFFSQGCEVENGIDDAGPV